MRTSSDENIEGVHAMYKDLGYPGNCNKKIKVSLKYVAALDYIRSLEGELRSRGVEL